MLAFDRGDDGDREFRQAGADRYYGQPDDQIRHLENVGDFNGSPDQ